MEIHILIVPLIFLDCGGTPMILQEVCELILRPRKFFERRLRQPVFLRAATCVSMAQATVVLFCLWMKHSTLTAEITMGSIVLVAALLSVRFGAGALFLYYVAVLSGSRSELLYRQCLSVVVYSYFIVLLEGVSAVVLGCIVCMVRGTNFSVVTFLNLNNLLALAHLPVFQILEKADIFAAWFIGMVAIGAGTFSSLRFSARVLVAFFDWIFVSAIQESITQFLKLSLYG